MKLYTNCWTTKEIVQMDFYILLQWLDLPNTHDVTWQPLQELYEDIPERMTEFLSTTTKSAKQETE